MNYEIKTATVDDLKDVQNLNFLLFKKEINEFDKTLNGDWTFSDEGEKYFRGRITGDDGCVLAAVSNGKIVGYLAGGIDHEKVNYRVLPKFAELENMFVMEEYRGQGIGEKLVQVFLDWCKSKDVKRLRVVASAANSRAIKFYNNNGFENYDMTLERDLVSPPNGGGD